MHTAHQALLDDIHSVSPSGVMLVYISACDVCICLGLCLMHRADQALTHNILHISICGTLTIPASEDHASHAAHCS